VLSAWRAGGRDGVVRRAYLYQYRQISAFFVTSSVYVRHMFDANSGADTALQLVPATPPTPPSPPPDNRPPAEGLKDRSPANEEVIDLGPATETSEAERARAIEEVVRLAARKSRGTGRQKWDALPPGPTKDVATKDAASDEEKNRMLRDVVSYATTMEWETTSAKPMESYRLRPIVLVTAAVLSLLLGAYAFTAHPAWIYGPDPSRVPASRREGHMRFAMYLTAQRLFAYRDSTAGALPPSLKHVGENWYGLRYTVLDGGSFELEAFQESRRPLSFRSDNNPRILRDAAIPLLRTVTP
jgi:hypothetical protein